VTERPRPDKDVLALVRKDLLAMPGYEPIEPIDVVARRLGIPESEVVKLDGNENPYGPAPEVLEALGRFEYFEIYPDPQQRRLRQAVADYVGADPDQIILGNGSDELLDIIARLLLSPGDAVLNAPPTFGMYDFVARIYAASLIEVPRLEDFTLDLPAMERALDDGAKLLYLASPNNPTANPLPSDHLDRLLDHAAVVVVDEAYAEFAGSSFVEKVRERDNLIVVRTFSKWAGLAGLRAGYGVFPKPLAELVWKTKMPYNLNAAAEVAILASLRSVDALRSRVADIVEERERMRGKVDEIPWLRPFPSHTNFLLCEVRGRSAKDVRDELGRRGILVRCFDTPGVRNCLRISVGRPEHTDRLVDALSQIGAGVGG
jgi:histidinol-phosphate aminotransferase